MELIIRLTERNRVESTASEYKINLAELENLDDAMLGNAMKTIISSLKDKINLQTQVSNHTKDAMSYMIKGITSRAIHISKLTNESVSYVQNIIDENPDWDDDSLISYIRLTKVKIPGDREQKYY